ncbi:hypothetical protein THAOC_17329 [Thalassiosira oceanica]|uniref:Protein kinase domain-containing protein n=1 Tax=Thalassiosira oceanica TaxID=159749 RepID=K0S9X7_THAOC|nr:hypothetical protein THAOC_17329 [Thalassiosira oceanica]|eukprot:EJK62075.1 hypothetical protein THAOC_17329 [Thalassiosira oceanica]
MTTFASAEVATGFGMECDGPGRTGGLTSPAEAARLVSAEFFAEQRGAAVDGAGDAGTGGGSPAAADEIRSLPSLTDTPETVGYVRRIHGHRGRQVGRLSRRDFTITRHLGRGSFSDVFEVSVGITGSSTPKAAVLRTRNRRASLASSVTAPVMAGKNQKKLAMKCLRPQIRSDSELFISGAEDLVHETALLASLDHPNIIKLHARASGSLRDSFILDDGYFILLDRLAGTLTDRLKEWQCVPERLTGPGRDELHVARSVADAVAYLHSKRIVFRDLKPDNVGFDSSGTWKLFDFGFAEGLPEKSEDNPTGLLTGRSGTPRYMAPEVGMNSNTLKIGYGRPVDVYSFGVLFWQLCSKQRPFECIQTADEFESRVYMGDYRPDIDNRWPAPVQNIIKFCWQQRPKRRPAMKDVKAALDAVLTKQPAQQAHAVEDVRPRVKRDKRLTMSSVS